MKIEIFMTRVFDYCFGVVKVAEPFAGRLFAGAAGAPGVPAPTEGPVAGATGADPSGFGATLPLM
jgi:hypothetical protein